MRKLRPRLASAREGVGSTSLLLQWESWRWPRALTGTLHRAPKLSQEDTLLLAEFTNATGDSVFDDTLKQAISVQLAQSPFLSILSPARTRATLRLMAKPLDTKLTTEVASDLCQRAGCKAYISGSIASLGSQYVIGLEATNCKTGDPVAQEQVTAENKEQVLKALDEAATNSVRNLASRSAQSRSSTPRWIKPPRLHWKL